MQKITEGSFGICKKHIYYDNAWWQLCIYNPLLNSESFWGKHSYHKISTKKSGTAADQVFLYKLTFQKWQKFPRWAFPWLPHVFSRTCFYLQLSLGLKRGQEEFYLYIRSCLWKEKKILYARKIKLSQKYQIWGSDRSGFNCSPHLLCDLRQIPSIYLTHSALVYNMVKYGHNNTYLAGIL